MGCTRQQQEHKVTEEVYTQLEDVLCNTRQQLVDYMEMIQAKARSIDEDALMLSFFKAKKDYYHLKQEIEIPPPMVHKIEELKQSIQAHYLNRYLVFYDILFIDTDGNIFYTIRKQNDYQKNIFSEQFKDMTLAGEMKQRPSESFVDFQFYHISGEPSAFFIEPVKLDNELAGWFVFQCSINKINSIFSIDKNLGATGEVFLVNREHYMLTDSRFRAESTILQLRLSDDNISGKFKDEKGRKTVVDYRGNKVLSVFETFSFLESEWLIIAKINEAEVLTRYYVENRDKIEDELEKVIPRTRPVYHDYFPVDDRVIEVDIDEFKRAGRDTVLYTHGLSTCTAITISYPGKFAYMAHVSPYDKIYGENRTDMLGQLLKRITYLEIADSEKGELRFTIISPGVKESVATLNRIVDNGYFLSQVKIMLNPAALYGNASSIFKTGETVVNWKMSEDDNTFLTQYSTDVPSIGSKLKQYLGDF
ncbi:MAG: cache domain-containing protein [Bacteroidota bacterium]